MRITSDLLLGLGAQVPLSSLNGADQPYAGLDSDPTIDVNRALTPRDLVEQPTVGTAVVNPSGTLLFVPYSQWSFDTDIESHSLRIHSLGALRPREYLHEISLPAAGEAFWYDDITLMTAVPNTTSRTTSLYASYFSPDVLPEKSASTSSGVGELVGVLPTDTAAYFRYSSAAHTLVFTARVFPDGDLATAVEQERDWKDRKGTARSYDGQTYMRFWDKYRGPMHSSLFSTSLSVSGGKWQLSDAHVNILNGTMHEVPAVDSLGSTAGNDFDISASQVVYTAKDPVLSESFHSKKNVYLADLDGRSPPVELTAGVHGGTFNPVFSPDGKLIAWLQNSKDGALSAKRYVVLHNTRTGNSLSILLNWDRSPESIAFSPDSTILYLTAPDMARVKVFAYPLYDTAHTAVPVALTQNGAASGLQPLSNGRLLYTHRTLTSPGNAILLSNIHAGAASNWSSIVPQEVTQSPSAASIAPHVYSGMEEFWFDGDARKIHGYVLKPRGWTPDAENKTWPVSLLIHGGPEGVWDDSWSVNFNPQLFSQRGYFVVAINPTGSISFGQNYTDAIIGDWGGAPMRDIVKGLKHVLNQYPEIDPKRAVAVGLSYGGYMVNMLQGHAQALGVELAAMANLDGIFSIESLAYTIDQPFFMNREWLGWPWENKTRSLFDVHSPHMFVHNWETPQLTIHGDIDFRVPVTEGIATFNALQQRNVPSRLLIFDKEPHVFTNRHNIVTYYDEIFDWFERFAGVRAGKST